MGKYLEKQHQPSIHSTKKVMRIVCHARSLEHTSKMFLRLDILRINGLLDINTCIFMCDVQIVLLALQNKSSMSSSKKHRNNFLVMFARTRRKQFSTSIYCASLL